MITEGAEMEQGIYKIRFDLFVSGNHESDSKDLEGLVTSCETEFIYDEKSVLSETDQYSFRLLPGYTLNFYPHTTNSPRIPTVKLKIPGQAFLKSKSQTSVSFKL